MKESVDFAQEDFHMWGTLTWKHMTRHDITCLSQWESRREQFLCKHPHRRVRRSSQNKKVHEDAQGLECCITRPFMVAPCQSRPEPKQNLSLSVPPEDIRSTETVSSLKSFNHFVLTYRLSFLSFLLLDFIDGPWLFWFAWLTVLGWFLLFAL